MRYDVVSSVKQVDLGTLSWNKIQETGYVAFYSGPLNSAQRIPAFIDGYRYSSVVSHAALVTDKTFTWFNSRDDNVTIRDDSFADKTAAEFKAAMSGKILTYVSTDAPRRFDMMQSTKSVEVSTLNWYTDSNSHQFYTTSFPYDSPIGKVDGIVNLWSDIYPTITTRQAFYKQAEGCCLGATGWWGNHYLIIVDNSISTVAELKAKISGHLFTYASTNPPKRFNFVNDTKQVDLGACTWTKENNSGGYYTTSITDIKKRGGSTGWNSNLFIDGYTNQRIATFPVLDMSFNGTSTHDWRQFNIRNDQAAGMTPAEFKSFISGTILTYESTQKETN